MNEKLSKGTTGRRFQVFSFLLCLASYIHLLAYAEQWLGSITGYLYLIGILLLLFKPGCIKRFTFFVVAALINHINQIPFTANHIFFETLVLINILLIIFLTYQKKDTELNSETLYTQMAPLIRSMVIILYLFAFWAKLNKDFFIPEVSCGGDFIVKIHRAYYPAFSPLVNWRFETPPFMTISIWLTVISELALPLLLLFRKTRTIGILFGIGFHFMMGIVPSRGIHSFSALSTALIFLFLSDKAFLVLSSLVDKCNNIARRYFTRPALLRISTSCVILYTVFHNYLYELPDSTYSRHIWLIVMNIIGAVIVYAVIQGWAQGRRDPAHGDSSFQTYFIPRPKIYILFLIPLLLNGFAPYLGLKTHGSLTMFSNLRIHGDNPNHLIMPKSLIIFDHELVEILETDVFHFKKHYTQKPVLIPAFEFRRIMVDIKEDFFFKVRYKGEIVIIGRFNGKLTDHELLKPLPWLAKKLLRYKYVSTLEHAPCWW